MSRGGVDPKRAIPKHARALSLERRGVRVSKGEIGVYRRHRPESTALYEVVRDNIETLFGAIDDGGLAVRIPKHARQELLAYLDCGLLCRGFARLKCRGCNAAPRPREFRRHSALVSLTLQPGRDHSV